MQEYASEPNAKGNYCAGALVAALHILLDKGRKITFVHLPSSTGRKSSNEA